MEILLICWALCAVGSAVIATSKGRSGFGWFFLGLIFGIFGLIMIAGMPTLKVAQELPPPPTIEKQRVVATIQCPRCFLQNRPNNNYCPQCGEHLPRS